jgi:hypothetical protein
MKAYWESGSIAARTLNLDSRCRSVVSFTPQPLYLPGKSHWYPLDRRLSGIKSRSGRGVKEKKYLIIAPTGNRTLVVQPVA